MTDFPSPTIADSRRLTGPNLFSSSVGAVLDVMVADDEAEDLVRRWTVFAAGLRAALGWDVYELHVRRQTGSASLFMAAPVDALMTATIVNEHAWVQAESRGSRTIDATLIETLRESASAEIATRPTLAAVRDAAQKYGVTVSFTDESLTLGSGAGAASWPLSDVPPAAEEPWAQARDVQIGLVTGANGKTTTTRLVAAMWRSAGLTPGWSCSDGVWAGDVQLEAGDFSGPGGARAVLNSPGVQAAVLETARGGMLRRGLGVTRADAAIITNISADHFGEYGINTLADLTDAKSIVVHALGSEGKLVLNADDAHLRGLASRVRVPVALFSIDGDRAEMQTHLAAGHDLATIRAGRVQLHVDRHWHDVGDLVHMPLTLGGTAHHNIMNVLGAALLGAQLGVPIQAIRETLLSFGSSADDNPGRLRVMDVAGVSVVVDYAHNPDGLASLCQTAARMPAKRRALILGQAGNRDDEHLSDLVETAFSLLHFDRVFLKEMPELARGRAAGEVTRVLGAALERRGYPAAQVDSAPTELEAVRRALAWADDGDLVLCPLHVEREAALALIAARSAG